MSPGVRDWCAHDHGYLGRAILQQNFCYLGRTPTTKRGTYYDALGCYGIGDRTRRGRRTVCGGCKTTQVVISYAPRCTGEPLPRQQDWRTLGCPNVCKRQDKAKKRHDPCGPGPCGPGWETSARNDDHLFLRAAYHDLHLASNCQAEEEKARRRTPLATPSALCLCLAETLCELPRVGCMTSASAMLGGLVVPWAQ